jgi:hypothetical protein
MTIYQTIVESAPRLEHELWRLYYPRMYRRAEAWGSPKVAAAALTSAAMMVRERGYRSSAATARDIAIAGCVLARYQTPALFLAPELLAALAQSEPPPETRWQDIHLPFEAALLMFPRGFMRHPTDGEIAFAGYARVRAGERLSVPGGGQVALDGDVFIVFTACHEAETMPMLDRVLNAATAPYVATDELLLGTHTRSGVFDLPLAASEGEFLRDLSGVVFRVLLGLEARPALLARGARDGTHKKSGVELWTPNVVGRDYRIARAEATAQGGTHASPRPHWRRGHFRRQAVGAGRTRHKTIWIEPMLIGLKHD